MKETEIIISGAKTNNLKNISLSIPKDKLVVSPVFPVPANLHCSLIPFIPRPSASWLKPFLPLPGPGYPSYRARM